jgi:hypothetical protein
VRAAIAAIAAIAAGAGAGAIDLEQLAQQGPYVLVGMAYLEARIRPLIVEWITQSKSHQGELEAHRKELTATRASRAPQLELVPSPER